MSVKHALLNLAFICFLVASAYSYAQVNLFEGREFYVAFLQNEHRELYDSAQQIHITSPKEATVRIKSPFSGAYKTYTVQPNTPLTVYCPKEVELQRGSIVSKTVYHITSNETVFVTAHSSFTASSDGYAVIPVRSWDIEHRLLTTPTDYYRTSSLDSARRAQDLQPRTGQFCVIASQDDTRIDVTPTVDLEEGFKAGERFVKVLQKGEVWHATAKPLPQRNTGDLSGTLIQSNVPVGVITGHIRSAWPVSDNYPFAGQGQSAGSKDHLIEMVPGISSCGTSFVTVPFGSAVALSTRGESYKLVATRPNTFVSYTDDNGTSTVNLENAGETASVFGVEGVADWTSNYPVYLAHIAQTAWFSNPLIDLGDPSLLFPPPLNQWVRKATCVIPETGNMDLYVVTVVCDASAQPRMGGQLLQDIASSSGLSPAGLKWFRVAVAPGHAVLECDAPMGIWVSAFGDKDSYAFPVSGGFWPQEQGEIALEVDSLCSEATIAIQSELPLFDIDITLVSGTADIASPRLFDTTTSIAVSIEQIDRSTTFSVTVSATDISGMSTQASLVFEALQLVGPEMLNLPSNVSGPYCTTATFENTSRVPVTVENVWLLGDDRLILSPTSMPQTLDPGQTISFEVCTDLDSGNPPAGRILIRVECLGDRFTSIGVRTAEPSIAVSHFRFPETLVQNSTCSSLDGIVLTNTGNENILLQGIDCANCPEEFEYIGPVFPLGLRVGEQRVFEFCFTPQAQGERSASIEFENDLDLVAIGKLSGFGVLLDIATQDIVFPPTRVGRENVLPLEASILTNTSASVDISSEPSNQFSLPSFADLPVNGVQTTTISVTFSPTQEGEHVASSNFVLRHGLGTVATAAQLSGLAILPDIQATTHNIGAVPVAQTTTTSLQLFTSIGSEQVSVQSVTLAGVDAQHFRIATPGIDMLQPGEAWQAELEFVAPSEARDYVVLAIMTSDAGPGYELYQDTSLVRVTVYSVDDNCLHVQLQGEAIQCAQTSVELIVSNTCDQAIVVDSTMFESSNSVLELNYFSLPRTLLPLETWELHASLSEVQLGAPVEIAYEIFSNTGAKRGAGTVAVTPTQEALQTHVESSSDVLPGELVKHTLNIIGSDLVEDTITVTHSFDPQALNLLRIDPGTGIPFNSTAPDGNVVFQTPVSGDTTTVHFYYQALLSANLTPIMQSTLTSECYEFALAIDTIHFNPVCLQDIRVIGNGQLARVQVAPNPVIDKQINFNLQLDDSRSADIQILNLNGKVVYNWSNFSLKKGKHSYNLTASALLPGLYTLIVRINQTISTQYIIIN